MGASDRGRWTTGKAVQTEFTSDILPSSGNLQVSVAQFIGKPADEPSCFRVEPRLVGGVRSRFRSRGGTWSRPGRHRLGSSWIEPLPTRENHPEPNFGLRAEQITLAGEAYSMPDGLDATAESAPDSNRSGTRRSRPSTSGRIQSQPATFARHHDPGWRPTPLRIDPNGASWFDAESGRLPAKRPSAFQGYDWLSARVEPQADRKQRGVTDCRTRSDGIALAWVAASR